MLKKVFAIATVVLTTILICSLFSACGDDKKEYEWEWDDPNDPDEPDQPEVSAKPRYIWVDAAANFPDFANSKENILRDLTLAKNAGFTDIVVDVRPTTGDVLYNNTTVASKVDWLGAWLPLGYSKVERTATWDYLQAFIDAGHGLGLKIHAAINTFAGGNATQLGNQGALFRDSEKKAWATDLNLQGGIISIMDSDQSTKFFNPTLPAVQDYLCSILKEVAAYDIDGIFLDRGRFDGFTSDFSLYTRQQFEAYAGHKVAKFPADIMPAGHDAGIPSPMPVEFKKWLEFRVKVIHDFMTKARTAVKSVNSKVKFGVYVGGWYGSYYDVGVNWASPKFNTSASYSWATPEYMNYGYADQMDHMLIGAYAGPGSVNGSGEWTMEGFCRLAKAKTMGDCPMVAGGPDVGNWDADNKFTQEQENQAVTNSVAACINACDGYFLFDMIHLKKANQWQYVKAGIDGLSKK